jgi:2-dehydro-3-deoxyphosphogluconate aldolase/(4S)-4-hydroxy-2-oxoglutarate aldolase
MNDREVIPIIVIEDAASAEPLARALQAGGIRTIEITLRTPAAIEAIRCIRSSSQGLKVIAGTVLSEEEAEASIDAGAQALVAPGFDPALSKWCGERAIGLIPGVATPTEIMAAYRSGHRLLKFFPAGVNGGLPALTALHAPFAKLGLSFIPTGGIGLADIAGYLACPFVHAVGGSWIAPNSLIAAKNWGEIERLARAAAEEAR